MWVFNYQVIPDFVMKNTKWLRDKQGPGMRAHKNISCRGNLREIFLFQLFCEKVSFQLFLTFKVINLRRRLNYIHNFTKCNVASHQEINRIIKEILASGRPD